MNREEGHIGRREGIVLLYAVLSGKLFVQEPTFLIDVGGPAAWQVAIVMTIGVLLLFLPTVALVNRFPGRSLGAIAEEAAGPFFGALLSFSVSLWLFFSFAMGLRNLTETFIATILPNTPTSVMMVTALICVLYASYRGLESLSRAAQILLPVIGAGIVVLLLFSLPRIDSSRLYPFWGYGAATTLTGGLLRAGTGAEAIVLLALGHAFRDGKSLRRSGYWSIILFGVSTVATILVLVMVFGAPDAAHQPFPLFNLARLVYLGRFLQRTESLLVMFWIFTLLIREAVLFHGAVATLTEALALPFYRPLTFPVALLGFSLAMVPEDQVAIMQWVRDWLAPLGVGVLLIPALLLLVAMARGKEGKAHEA